MSIARGCMSGRCPRISSPAYLDREWPAIGGCVGCYRMEGPGVQLFSRTEGSHFTILGMPMLPLLDYLRVRGVLTS
jgi:septum formation protein